MILLTILKSGSQQTEFVIELFRHGARKPKAFMSEYNPSDRENGMDLSITGMRNHYFLGSLTKKKYEYFFQNSVRPWTTHIAVSSTNRTISSAISNFIGLSKSYLKIETPFHKDLWTPPNVNNFEKSTNLHSLPNQIQFHPLDIQGKKTNFIFHSRKVCPLIKKLYKKQLDNAYQKLKNKFNSSYLVFENLGYDPKSMFKNGRQWSTKNLLELMDMYRCNLFNSKSTKWTYESKLHMEVLLAIKTFARVSNQNLTRIRLFSLYKDWLDKIQQFLDSKGNTLRFAQYSAHNNNLSLVLYDLFGKSDLNCMINQYQIHLQNQKISSKEDYIKKKQLILKSGCFWFIPFTTSIFIEVYSDSKV